MSQTTKKTKQWGPGYGKPKDPGIPGKPRP